MRVGLGVVSPWVGDLRLLLLRVPGTTLSFGASCLLAPLWSCQPSRVLPLLRAVYSPWARRLSWLTSRGLFPFLRRRLLVRLAAVFHLESALLLRSGLLQELM